MNTGFLNWYRVLASKRSKVLIITQMLCLGAVAAIFLASPLVVLAGGCGGGGGNNNAVQVNKKGTVLGTVTGVSKFLPTGATLVNGTVPIPGTPGGVITLNSKFALKDLQPGTWVSGIYEGVPFQGTIFSLSKVNNGVQVCEMWIADPAPNNNNVKPGLIVKNFALASSLAGSSASSTSTN